jgi:hypothetical protein
MLRNNLLYLAAVSKTVKVTDLFLIHNPAEIISYETVLQYLFLSST